MTPSSNQSPDTPLHVVVGASGIGVAVAEVLAARGDRVRLVTRRGTGPEHPAIERIATDASDADRLTALTQGAAVLYNCANPPYNQWLTDWPALAAALLTAAERTGAVLASAATLYGYGPVDGPMPETAPLVATHPKLRLRAQMWHDVEAAHRAGRIRAVELRASDFLQGTGVFSLAIAPSILAGKRALVPMPLDHPHTWSSVTDAATTLITLAADERAWGQPWHVPSNPPLTVRELAQRFSDVTGSPAPTLTAIPYAVLWTAGLFNPLVRELRTTRYQWDRPFVMDSTTTAQTFDLKPQPLDDALRAAASRLRG